MEGYGLKKDNLNMIETIAMSVAIVAPTASMSLNVPLMTKTAGISSPFVFFVSMIIVGFVSYSIIKFNHYFSSAGSLYTFTERSLGKNMGFIAGWTLLLAYMMLVVGCSAGLGSFCSSLLNVFGIHIFWLPLSLIFSIIMIFVGTMDAKVSTRIMFVMEGISIFLITLLSVVVIYKVGVTKGLSVKPFKINGNSTSSIASTSVLAFLSFIGFESASSLGEETKNPKKYIPIAIISAVFVTGIFYLLSSYSQVIGFGVDSDGLKNLASSTLPLTYLADKFVSKTYGTFLILSAVLSFFSCSLGAACAGARMLFSMSRDGVMHKNMKKVHPKYKTPYFALITIIAGSMIIQTIFFYKQGIKVFEYCATIGSLAIIVSYLFTSMASIVYFTKKKLWSKLHSIVPILSIVALIYILFSNVYPVPQFPNNLFPYIVLGWIAIGFVLGHKFKYNINQNITENSKSDDIVKNVV